MDTELFSYWLGLFALAVAALGVIREGLKVKQEKTRLDQIRVSLEAEQMKVKGDAATVTDQLTFTVDAVMTAPLSMRDLLSQVPDEVLMLEVLNRFARQRLKSSHLTAEFTRMVSAARPEQPD